MNPDAATPPAGLCGTLGSKTTRLPREAREGLMRAWIEVLSNRHPAYTWIPDPQTSTMGAPEGTLRASPTLRVSDSGAIPTK